MIDRKQNYVLPRTVDQAAELLISDLLLEHLQAITMLSESDFQQLCKAVAPYIIDEFQLYTGNDALLNDCFSRATSSQQTDPVTIILASMRSKLTQLHDIYIVE